MTFTIMGRCKDSGRLGIATATNALAVGVRVPFIRPRLGAVSIMAIADPRLGDTALQLLELGYKAPRVVEALAEGDPYAEYRQLGVIDDDGYVSIVGRNKDLVISGGFNVYPREVEDVLREHHAVADVAVVGTPSDEWGEEVTAYVVGDPVSAQEVREHVEGRLAPYKRPRIVHHVEELPRNALGKVQKHRLRGGRVVD